MRNFYFAACVQAKALMGFTKMDTANLDKKALEDFCTPMKNATKDTMDLVQRCHPEALKKARALCWGDGKGDKGDGKGDGKGDAFVLLLHMFCQSVQRHDKN